MKIKSYLLGILFIFFAHNQIIAQPQYEVAFSESLNADIPKDFFSGRYVILDFWQTWCAPCIASFEETNELIAKYNSEEIVFANITNETTKIDRIKRILDMNPFDGYQLIDANNQTFTQFKVMAFPTVVILGKTGALLWRGFPGNLNEALILEKTGIAPSLHPTNNNKENKDQQTYTLEISPSNAQIRGSSYRRNTGEQIKIQFVSAALHSIVSQIKEIPSTRIVSNDANSNGFGIDINGDFPVPEYTYERAFEVIMSGLEERFGFVSKEISQEEEVWIVGAENTELLLQWKSEKRNSSSGFSRKKANYTGASLKEIFSSFESKLGLFFELSPNMAPLILNEKYDLTLPLEIEKLKTHLQKHYGLTLTKKRKKVTKIQLEFRSPVSETFDPEAEIAKLMDLYKKNFDPEKMAGAWTDFVYGEEVQISLQQKSDGSFGGSFAVDNTSNPISVLKIDGNYMRFSTEVFGEKLDFNLWFVSADIAKGHINKQAFVNFKRK